MTPAPLPPMPTSGGSYIRDPETGALTLMPEVVAEEASGEAITPIAPVAVAPVEPEPTPSTKKGGR